MGAMVDVPLASAPAGVSGDTWEAACTAVRDYCGWHIAPEVTETLTLDGPGGTLLRLPSLLVSAVAEVTNAGTVLTDPEWSPHGMVRAHAWTERFRGVTVTLTHGYRECPPDILAIVRHMAAQAEFLAQSGEASVASTITTGPFTYQASASALAGAVGLSGQHRGVLDRYKLAPRP